MENVKLGKSRDGGRISFNCSSVADDEPGTFFAAGLDGNVYHVANGVTIEKYSCSTKGKKPTVECVLYTKIKGKPTLLASANNKELIMFDKNAKGTFEKSKSF